MQLIVRKSGFVIVPVCIRRRKMNLRANIIAVNKKTVEEESR